MRKRVEDAIEELIRRRRAAARGRATDASPSGLDTLPGGERASTPRSSTALPNTLAGRERPTSYVIVRRAGPDARTGDPRSPGRPAGRRDRRHASEVADRLDRADLHGTPRSLFWAGTTTPGLFDTMGNDDQAGTTPAMDHLGLGTPASHAFTIEPLTEQAPPRVFPAGPVPQAHERRGPTSPCYTPPTDGSPGA